MKLCIVNADDFGASLGINRGIAQAHLEGVVTSTSLMVDMPACEEAAGMSHDLPALSIGLHACFTSEEGKLLFDPSNPQQCRHELQRQFERFQRLMDTLPTHLDSHHHIHRHPLLLPHFLELAQQHGLPLREHSPAHYFGGFYGQWDNQSHLEHISPESLMLMLESEIMEGITELGCHPGYQDPVFVSVYSAERESELKTLCSPLVKDKFDQLGIRRINFSELREYALDS
jgi:predicted glycoside hydrolase/deacetylase ChbG (UPF0249 family)